MPPTSGATFGSTEARRKNSWKGGLPLERRTTRAGLLDVYTRHIRVLVIRKYVDSTFQGGDRARDPFGHT